MSKEAMLPCFKCGKTLPNIDAGQDNQPYGGTEFRTYGHYGSTFWDSFDGEELVLNICDDCLRQHTDRLAQHKRYATVRCERHWVVGRQWLHRPMVPYTGNRDDSGDFNVEPEELGTDLYGKVEWVDDLAEIKDAILRGEP